MTDQAPQRTRLTKSKATASTTAIQTLEITTTAVVTGSNSNDTQDASPPTTTSTEEETAANDIQRKQSHHHHHHHRIRSPAFEAHSNMASPLPSPQFVENTTPVSAELMLPPPIVKGPSEAIVALQDAANGKYLCFVSPAGAYKLTWCSHYDTLQEIHEKGVQHGQSG